MSEDLVNIEIDGVPLQAAKGEMVIKVADEAGMLVPRFCYHKNLSVAANCRMCLVEVERAPKPMPACATPVAEGMKIYTKSPAAIAAQKNTMEFLLINHPLDCPVCDQGGECELQDLALGYGHGVSQYTEGKRSVDDQDIGPLISTDMTRCIHCTRCVRFGEEVAGIRELGTPGRGEHMRIRTYVGRTVDHELSGNVIDLCPVGALNSKPFRMKGRGWEMTQNEAIAPHDSVGSNIFAHTLRGQLMRVVPQENDAINETWIADRDRFSYEALDSLERLERPMVRDGDNWHEVDWQTALERAAEALKSVSGDDLGVLGAPTQTLEELFLLQDVARKLGTTNIDHRLSQVDFRDDGGDPVFPWLGQSIESIDALDATLVIGSHIRHEAPIIANRLRKAVLAETEIKYRHRVGDASTGGCDAMFINPRDFEYHFPVAEKIICKPSAMVESVAGVVKALAEQLGTSVPNAAQTLVNAVVVSEAQHHIAAKLTATDNALIVLGRLAMTHPAYADIRALAAAASELAGVRLGYLAPAANTVGAAIAGVLPHRGPGGRPLQQTGANARAQFQTPRKAYLLLGLEPELDSHDGGQALAALRRAKDVVAVSSFVTPVMQSYASVLLPMGAFGESAGTFVNCEGRWQSYNGFTASFAEARPGWKILRVLGNMLDLEGFQYETINDVREALTDAIGQIQADNQFHGTRTLEAASAETGKLERTGAISLYAGDPLVRRSEPLQRTRSARAAALVNEAQAEQLGVGAGEVVEITQANGKATLPLEIDNGIPDGTVWVPAAVAATAELGSLFGSIEIRTIQDNTAEEA